MTGGRDVVDASRGLAHEKGDGERDEEDLAFTIRDDSHDVGI